MFGEGVRSRKKRPSPKGREEKIIPGEVSEMNKS
jgi:hypothetical protein